MTDNVNTYSKGVFSDMQLQQALLDEQALIAKELQVNQGVTPLPYNPNATVLYIQKILTCAPFTISLSPEHCRTRQLIFGVFNAVAYRYQMTDDFPKGRKNALKFYKPVWRYLDTIALTDENRATWLKDYETWRVSENRVKTQSTGLEKIKLFINDALALSAFNETLTDYEREYLVTLANTSTAPREEADAINLSQWFSRQTWLRRDDIGIGHELYTRLDSPKALINSFRVTIETTLLYLQTCKDALIDGFRNADLAPEDVPTFAEIVAPGGQPKPHHIMSVKAEMLNRLRQKLVPLINDTPYLNNALELVVFVETLPQYRKKIFDKLLANQPIFAASKTRSCGFFTAKKEIGLFDVSFLKQLALHAASPPDHNVVPVSLAESLLFSYLMAYQTVQTGDIPKLTLRNFKFVKRRNGAITHIECDYFKGRAKNKAHQVETLKTTDNIGKAVLRYILDMTAFREQDKPLTPAFKRDICSPANLTGLLFLACKDTALSQVINEKHQAQRVAPAFPKAVQAMLCNGTCYSPYLKLRCETALPLHFFGFTHVKTSAVYTGSDSFDPTSLINLRSHNNETERVHYLGEMNQEWLDNCGLVTRAVMRDLYVNVFTASQSDRQLFETEFTKAVEQIKTRANDVLTCLKVVTQQTSGHVDELGLVSARAQIDSDLPDTIYIQDSPETVLKLKHFLAQLQEKHALLRERAPEYLFFTALPTAEWIENLLDNKRFSKMSLEKAQAIYDKYRSHLPPHFTAQLA
jgi:hypothetical protein